MRISREEFNQAIGAALSALRVERGFSQAEVAEGINAIPEVDRQERSTRAVAAYAALSIILRNEQGLTQEELAKHSQVPVEFVCGLEAGKDPNPDFYFLYCLSIGFDLPLQNLRTGLKSYRTFPMKCFWRTKPTKRGATMSRARVKTIRLEHKHGTLFDYSVKGKEIDHIRFSQAERSVVYVTVLFADRTEWSISIEPFSLPTARVSHFVSTEEDPIADSGQMFLPDHPDCCPRYEQIEQPPKQQKPGKRSRK